MPVGEVIEVLQTKEQARAYELGVRRVEASGLTRMDYHELGLVALGRRHTLFKVIGLKVPYWDPLDQRKPLHGGINHVLCLAPGGIEHGLLCDGKGIPTPAGAAYFAQSVNWAEVAQDVSRPIVLTDEGELSAVKACKEGIETISITGPHDLDRLKELEVLGWAGRKVLLVFESQKLGQVAAQLVERGAQALLQSAPQRLDAWCIANPGAGLLGCLQALV